MPPFRLQLLRSSKTALSWRAYPFCCHDGCASVLLCLNILYCVKAMILFHLMFSHLRLPHRTAASHAAIFSVMALPLSLFKHPWWAIALSHCQSYGQPPLKGLTPLTLYLSRVRKRMCISVCSAMVNRYGPPDRLRPGYST